VNLARFLHAKSISTLIAPAETAFAFAMHIERRYPLEPYAKDLPGFPDWEKRPFTASEFWRV
jgi:hypothetical protein